MHRDMRPCTVRQDDSVKPARKLPVLPIAHRKHHLPDRRKIRKAQDASKPVAEALVVVASADVAVVGLEQRRLIAHAPRVWTEKRLDSPRARRIEAVLFAAELHHVRPCAAAQRLVGERYAVLAAKDERLATGHAVVEERLVERRLWTGGGKRQPAKAKKIARPALRRPPQLYPRLEGPCRRMQSPLVAIRNKLPDWPRMSSFPDVGKRLWKALAGGVDLRYRDVAAPYAARHVLDFDLLHKPSLGVGGRQRDVGCREYAVWGFRVNRENERSALGARGNALRTFPR